MDAKLVVVGGDAKTKEVNLRLPAVIGPGREATLTLPHPLVSRQHCELLESPNGTLMIRDLGSLNGTFINNQRITEQELPPGELLTVGTVTFRAVYEVQGDTHPPHKSNGDGNETIRTAAVPSQTIATADAAESDMAFEVDASAELVDEAEVEELPMMDDDDEMEFEVVEEVEEIGDTADIGETEVAKPRATKTPKEEVDFTALIEGSDDDKESDDEDLSAFLGGFGK